MKFIIAVCKLTGEHKTACFVCVECVKCSFLGIVDSLRNVLLIVNAPNFETYAGYRNDITCLCVLLYYADVCCNNSVVEDILIFLTIFINDNVEVLDIFSILPACGLMYGICSVRKLLCLSIAVFICCEIVTLSFLCLVIATSTLEIYLELNSVLGSINACCAVIAVLY